MTARDVPLFGADVEQDHAIEDAAAAQLQLLTDRGLLTADHAILRASILGLARSMDRSAHRGQSVALAHASKELREWYLLIPAATDPDDPFMQLLREASAASGGRS